MLVMDVGDKSRQQHQELGINIKYQSHILAYKNDGDRFKYLEICLQILK